MTAIAADEGAVRIRGVGKSFAGPAGTMQVLRGVDLTILPGEIVAVVGRSGSGKSTLLTIVAGLDHPDSGDVRLRRGDRRPEPPAWRDVAIVPQSLGLLDELTVAENISLPHRLGGTSPSRDVADLMARLGIDHLAQRFPSEASLGEQQRTALARAVTSDPGVLLADEPISHQNQGWSEVVVEVLRDLAASGTACLLATHNEIAFRAADRVLELRAGRLHRTDGAGGDL